MSHSDKTDHNPFISPFISAELSPPSSAQWRAKRRVVNALRNFHDVLITSTPEEDQLDSIADYLEQQTTTLERAPRLYGIRSFTKSKKHGSVGEINHEINAVGGWSNPLSPGLNMWLEDQLAFGEVCFGWAYEGPPGFVHGGFIAAVFDQFLGMAHLAQGKPGMTGTLDVHYHRPTPLNTEIQLRGEITPAGGRKTIVNGEMLVDNTLTASAKGLFIRPRNSP